ncbi:hypothetical protein [Helicobacter cetorum]|uniref:hypothetical protein n=1 Tax=Helicobacter cetorum TaxID=138563 RepID=UPI000CF0B94F|nr:hypothetical protein [Helicobacter cetorum]
MKFLNLISFYLNIHFLRGTGGYFAIIIRPLAPFGLKRHLVFIKLPYPPNNALRSYRLTALSSFIVYLKNAFSVFKNKKMNFKRIPKC